MTETETTNSATTTTEEKPSKPAKKRAGSSRRKHGRRKAAASGARPATKSRKSARARTSKGPKPHTRLSKRMASQGRYVLVIHMSKETQRALDKAISKTEDSRSSYCRRVVESRLGIKPRKA